MKQMKQVNNKKFYKIFLRDVKKFNFKEEFGINSSWKWFNDPRQFFFSLSRYKFVSKILEGKKNVLEVGCSDGFNSRIVKQTVGCLDICDVEPKLLENARSILNSRWKMNIFYHDFEKKKIKKKYDAIYLLDVLEHINKNKEFKFIKNIIASLEDNGVTIVGIPSLEFQKFSRPIKISGHVNCKSGTDLKKLLEKFFYNVIIFSMNDETVHTGFDKMACYLFAVCFAKR
jgi:2-polyprenyl-3-methyl-5-hydroxy-6-metoxy-1,4-benzoquinol methylase